MLASGTAMGPPVTPALCELWTLLANQRTRLVRMLAAHGENITDAEDYVQETFVRVAALPTVDLTRVPGLLSVVAMRIACDAHRRHARSQRLWQKLGAICPVESPEEIASLRQEATTLWAAAAKLPARERAVVELCAAGSSLGEAAKDLGVSYKAVESALGRARAKLRVAAYAS